jgi:hypothetical protein
MACGQSHPAEQVPGKVLPQGWTAPGSLIRKAWPNICTLSTVHLLFLYTLPDLFLPTVITMYCMGNTLPTQNKNYLSVLINNCSFVLLSSMHNMYLFGFVHNLYTSYIHTECVYFEPGHLNYLALRSPERLLVKISYIALSISRSFCFRPFSLSLT